MIDMTTLGFSYRKLIYAFLGVLPLTAGLVSAQTTTTYEDPPVIEASNLLDAGVLRGPQYRVRAQVPTDGYMARISVDSDFGSFTCIGVSQAKQRIAETEAIRKLVETSKGDLFAEGLKRSVEQPIDAVKNIVKNPVDSVKRAPKTVGHFFSKVGATISRTASQVEDRIENRDQEEVDAAQVGQRIGHAARNAAGFDKAKLECARQLGVDPYSDNERLQEEMDKVTWAFFAGGLPLRIGAMASGASLALNATTMVGLPEDIYEKTPDEIALRDKNTLAAMGVTEQDITAFQIQKVLSVTQRHKIVRYLDALPSAKGRGFIVRLANDCTAPQQGDFLVRALSILAEQQKSGAADYARLEVIGRLPAGRTTQGELQVPAPVDYVSWTEEVAQFAQRDDLGSSSKTLLTTGTRTPKAEAGIQAAGWKTVRVVTR